MLLNLTEGSVAVCLLLLLPQVHSRLRSPQDKESKNLHLLDQEFLARNEGSRGTGYDSACQTNSDCIFIPYPAAAMKCCDTGKDKSTCHFICNALAHSPTDATAQVASSEKGRPRAATAIKTKNSSPFRVDDILTVTEKEDTHAYSTEMFSYNYNYNYDYNYGAKLITDAAVIKKKDARVTKTRARATTHKRKEIDTVAAIKTTSVSPAENSRSLYEFAAASVKRHRAAKKHSRSNLAYGVFSYNYGGYGYGNGNGYRKLSDYTVARHKTILSDLPLSKATGGDSRPMRNVKSNAVPPLISPVPPLISPVPPTTKPALPLPKPEPPMDTPEPPMAMPMPLMPKLTPLPPRTVPPPLATMTMPGPTLDYPSSASPLRETLIVFEPLPVPVPVPSPPLVTPEPPMTVPPVLPMPIDNSIIFEPIPVPVPILDPQMAMPMPMPVMPMPKPAPLPPMTEPVPPMVMPMKPKKDPKPPSSKPEVKETVSPSPATTPSPSDG